MVRACCVLGCTSIGTTSSHVFPSNLEIRNKWMQNLKIKPFTETEIHKLRVCYKHFHDSNYTGIQNRRLSRFAVPFMTDNSSSDLCIEVTENPCQAQIIQDRGKEQISQIREKINNQEQIVTQQQDDIAMLQNNVIELQNNVQTFSETQKIVIDLQNKFEALSQIQVQFDKDVTHKVGEKQNSRLHTRPNPRETTRRKKLCPKARQFYETTIKLQKKKDI